MFCGIEDHVKYNDLDGSENRGEHSSFGEADGCACCAWSHADRRAFGTRPGFAACLVLPSSADSLFAQFRPHGTEFRGIQDHAKYNNNFDGSEKRDRGGSFDG